ncbi:MAG: hypothetical protein ACKO3B_04085 [Bacteroidota bacterium]
MKAKWFTLLFAGSSFVALAQTESDDLYFSAADRQREISARPRTVRVLDAPSEVMEMPTQAAFDGYFSGRSVNPDYDPAVSTNVSDYNYFDDTYASAADIMSNYNGYRSGNYPSSSFGNGWNNSWSYGSGFGMGRYGYSPFYDPFNNFGYGGYYDPFNRFGGMNPWNGGGWGSSWSMTIYGGNRWMGMNPYSGFGFNNFYSYNAFGGGFYSGYNSFWNPYANMAYGYDSRPKLTYGKRPSRSSDFDNDARQQARRYTVQSSGNAPRAISGRSSAGAGNNTYYQRGWRQDPSINPRVSTESSGYSGVRGNSWSREQNSSWGNSDWGNSRGSSVGSGSRSSGGFSGSGFSGGGSHGGSSGGRRGRD